MEAPRRQPLTPRGLSSQNLKATPAKSLKATPAKGGNAEEVSLDSTRSEYAGKAPAASADAFEMEENNPELAHEQQPARGEAKQHTLSTNNEKSRTLIQMTETQNAVFSQRKADLDAREFQMLNQMEMASNEIREYAEAAQRAKSNELMQQKKLHDMEIAMQAEVAALKAEHAQAVQRLHRQHDGELDELQLQTAEDTMQDIMTKVSRLQAAIGEAAAQVGITVSWHPPSFANSGLQEEFEEMGAWLSRISDTLHQLSRERRRLKEAHREEAQRRREVQAELFDLQGPVQVLCRLHNDADDKSDNESVGHQDCNADPTTPHTTGRPVHDPATPNRIKVNSNRYNFQTVFPESEGLEELFEELEPTVLSVLDGHNVCILSHELTDSSSHATLLGSDVDSGLSARCAEALFEAAAADPSLTSARLHVSFVEMSESAVYDIMASNPQGRGGKQDQRESWIEIDPMSDSVGVHQQEVEDPEDAADVLQSCFEHRQKNASGQISSKDASRGHTLTCITVTTSNEGLETVSYLWVAGLSGSAVLAAQDGLEDDLRDTPSGNCSLSALATCLAVRCQGRSNVPWSDSPLTCLLKGCLGSGSRVVLLVNLSEAGPVNTSTAASLDWMHHLQSLSTARHMSAHTLTQDDSSTTAGHSMMQLHPVTSPPHLTATDEPPATVEAVDSATALKSVLSEARTLDSSAVLAVPAELEDGSQPHQEALVAEVEQLKARVQELLGQNARLHAQVNQLSSKQVLVQADAAFMSDYKVNSALARHSLSARCSDLEAQLSEAKSALTRSRSCASPTSLSKQSSRDCSEACDGHFVSAQPSFMTAASSLPLMGSVTSGDSGAVSAPLQDLSSTVKAAAVATYAREGPEKSTAAQLLTVGGESLNSDSPTSEDLDVSPDREFATFGTTLDTNTSVGDAKSDGDLVVGRLNLQPALEKLPEASISEDSLIKSSSFLLQPSSITTRCESDAVVVSHHDISSAGTFQDNATVIVQEAPAAAYSRSVQPAWTTQTAATLDSSRMDSDLLAVLSDCPSPSLANPTTKVADETQAPGATPAVPSPEHFGLPRHSFVPEAQRLPEVFESLDLAHFLESDKASKAAGQPAIVTVPKLTIPALPPTLSTHQSTTALSSAQKPAPPCVLDSVDLSSFLKAGADTPRLDGSETPRSVSVMDTPRSVNVMDSVDLSAFMKAESECSAMAAAAQKQGSTRVMDSVDLSAFIKGEASGEDAAQGKAGGADGSQTWQASGSVPVMDSVDLSNFLKSDKTGVHVQNQQEVTDFFDFNKFITTQSDAENVGPGEDSYGRLQCIAEESETPDIFVSLAPDVNEAEAAGPNEQGAMNSSEAPAQPPTSQPVSTANHCAEPSALPDSEQVRTETSVATEIKPPAASASEASTGSSSRVPDTVLEKPATMRPTANAAQYECNFKQILTDNDADEGILSAFNGQPEDQTISLAPAINALRNQHQVTPTLGAMSARSRVAPIDSAATDRLLCDSSEGGPDSHEEREPAAQHFDADATDGRGWGGAERLDLDFDDEDVEGRMPYGPNSGGGSGSGRRASMRLSLGRAGEGLRGLFSSRKGEKGDSKAVDRRWSMSVTPRDVTPRGVTPRGVTPRGVTPRGVTPHQGAAGDDSSAGGLKTPRSILGSRASIDKLMRSAFKRSTTLLASARRRQQRPEPTACVPEEQPAATAPLVDTAHRSSSNGAAVQPGPATPRKLDFCTANSGAPSPDVNQSTQSLQSAHSNEISPVLGFINPAIVAETAHVAAAAARSKKKLQQQHETAPVNQEIFAGAVAVPATSMPRLGAVRTTTPRTLASAAQPASRLPRSPVVDPNRGHNASQSMFLSPSAVPASVSALPRSPFNRLKAALQSQRRQFEQDERRTLSPHTMPAPAPAPAPQGQPTDETLRSGSQTKTCIQNPHFTGHAYVSSGVGASGPLQTHVPATAAEESDDVLRGSLSLPLGLKASMPAPEAEASGGNTLLLAHDIAPPTASYAWLVNGPSAPSSQTSQHTLSTAAPGPLKSQSSDHQHHSQAAHSTIAHSPDRPTTSPLPQPLPAAMASLRSASNTDLHHRLHTAPSLCEGASALLLARGSAASSLDVNPTEIIRQGRNGASEEEVGIARARGSYWRRGAPLKSSHKGTSLHSGTNGGSSRGSSPGDFRSVSPPLPAQMHPSFVSRQFPAASKDASLLASSASASCLATQHSFLRQQKLRTAPLADHQARDEAEDDHLHPGRRDDCQTDDKAREEKAKEAYERHMKELQEHTGSLHTPAPALRDSSSLMSPATSQLKKPPGRVSHAKAAQQMAKANADHKRLVAAAAAGAKRKSKAWM